MGPPEPAHGPGGFTDGYALAQDAAGGFYVADTQGQDIWVVKSPDGGSTWSATTVSRWATEVDGIADRPWLATNGANAVALVDNGAFGENCDYSTDGGATFTTRATANMDQGRTNAGNVLFDRAGHVTYAVQSAIASWRGPTICSAGGLPTGIPTEMALPPSGAQIFTQLALDGSDRPYVTQPTPGNGAMELRAFDGWGGAYKSLVVSPAGVGSNTFGAVAARDTGEIAVAWYGSAASGDPSGAFSGTWNVYLARVKDLWTATPTIQVDQITTTGMHQDGICMGGISCFSGRGLGDYMGVAYDNAGNVHVAYVDDAHGGSRVYHAKLAAI